MPYFGPIVPRQKVALVRDLIEYEGKKAERQLCSLTAIHQYGSIRPPPSSIGELLSVSSSYGVP
jgi:hypothetical protein